MHKHSIGPWLKMVGMSQPKVKTMPRKSARHPAVRICFFFKAASGSMAVFLGRFVLLKEDLASLFVSTVDRFAFTVDFDDFALESEGSKHEDIAFFR